MYRHKLRPEEAKQSNVHSLSVPVPHTEHSLWRESCSQTVRFWAKGSLVRDVNDRLTTTVLSDQEMGTMQASLSEERDSSCQEAQITHSPPQTKRPPYDLLQARQVKDKSVISETCSQSVGTSEPWEPSLNPDSEVEAGQTLGSQATYWLVAVRSGLDLCLPWPESSLIPKLLLCNEYMPINES